MGYSSEAEEKWVNLSCPICGEKLHGDNKNFGLVGKRFYKEPKDVLEVKPYECHNCGYIMMRKVK